MQGEQYALQVVAKIFYHEDECQREKDALKVMATIDPDGVFSVPSVPLDAHIRACLQQVDLIWSDATCIIFPFAGVQLGQAHSSVEAFGCAFSPDGAPAFSQLLSSLTPVVHGLKVMSSHGFMHGDLTCETSLTPFSLHGSVFNFLEAGRNVLIDHGHSRLIDFGFAAPIEQVPRDTLLSLRKYEYAAPIFAAASHMLLGASFTTEGCQSLIQTILQPLEMLVGLMCIDDLSAEECAMLRQTSVNLQQHMIELQAETDRFMVEAASLSLFEEYLLSDLFSFGVTIASLILENWSLQPSIQTIVKLVHIITRLVRPRASDRLSHDELIQMWIW